MQYDMFNYKFGLNILIGENSPGLLGEIIFSLIMLRNISSQVVSAVEAIFIRIIIQLLIVNLACWHLRRIKLVNILII